MVARKATMERLVAWSERRIRVIGAQLAEARSQAEALNEKLSLLQRYSEEYGERLSDSLYAGMSAGDYRNYHRFMGQLGRAVRLQREALKEHDSRLSELQDRWLSARRRKLAYETLQVRIETEEQCVALRRMQRQMDELARRAREHAPEMA